MMFRHSLPKGKSENRKLAESVIELATLTGLMLLVALCTRNMYAGFAPRDWAHPGYPVYVGGVFALVWLRSTLAGYKA